MLWTLLRIIIGHFNIFKFFFELSVASEFAKYIFLLRYSSDFCGGELSQFDTSFPVEIDYVSSDVCVDLRTLTKDAISAALLDYVLPDEWLARSIDRTNFDSIIVTVLDGVLDHVRFITADLYSDIIHI